MRQLLDNPHENAGLFSKLFFQWTIPLFKRGYNKVLELEDIFKPLNVDKSDVLGDRLEAKWNDECTKSNNPSLTKTLFKTFWLEISILNSIAFITEIIFRLGQPILLGKVLRFFRKRSIMPIDEAAFYAAALIIVNLLNMLFLTHFLNFGSHYAMKVRIAVSSIIYRKIFYLSPAALNQVTPGKVVNLLSNDISRFDNVLKFLSNMWTTPLTIVIIIYWLWLEVKWAGIFGLSFAFILIPIQIYSGHLSSNYRIATAKRTDHRVQFMNEIISGAQVIKMYAWEKPFTKLIGWIREMELKMIQKNNYIRIFHIMCMFSSRRVTLFCTMIAIYFIYGSEKLTADRIFVMVSYLNTASLLLSITYVRGFSEITQAMATLKRLQEFLELAEENRQQKIQNLNQETYKNLDEKIEHGHLLDPNKLAPKNIIIPSKNLKHKFKHGVMQFDNNNVISQKNDKKLEVSCKNNIEIPKGKLIGIVGPVGSGKSLILQALLHENSCTITIDGVISYASQEPWIFPGTVRQNILFGEKMDRHRYIDVIKACALVKDFEQLEKSDYTIIGERGASLSGGQKARINLARAMYRKADIYLFDDPLSAVDPHVGRHIFDECLGPQSPLAHMQATRILVTHQVHFLKKADWIIIMRECEIEAQGTPELILQNKIEFDELKVEEKLPEKLETVSLRSSIRSRHSTSILYDELFPQVCNLDGNDQSPEMEMEKSSRGSVKGNIFLKYFYAGAHWTVLSGILLLFVVTQALLSGIDLFVSYWTKQEELRLLYESSNETDREKDSLTPPRFTTEQCIYINGGLILVLTLITLTRAIGYFEVVTRASRKLHEIMFNSVINASMQFFNTNSSGRILNRFSKDIGAVDEVFPRTVIDAIHLTLLIAGSITLTFIANPPSLIPVFILSFFFFYASKIYLRTSKNVKRLEQITKSPVFTHITTTFEGLTTIKAFKAEQMLKKEFDDHQNIHSACNYMFIVTGYAFTLLLDLLNSIFLVCVILIFFLIDTGASSDKVGLVITQAMGLTGIIQLGIRQIAEIINQLMPIERVLEYHQLTSEIEPEKPCELIESWPERGEIKYTNVVYRYQPDAEPILHGLTFTVHSMEKIGIVGRTGAGKSSLIGALFRLAHIEGEIFIDGISTSMINLNDLRSHISIIPQDPILFSESLRYNLDPFKQHSDADVWKALEEVEMKGVAKEGLETVIQANGSNLSVGQRQLICLARAILRKNQILVLDEATANIDPQTDCLIRQTIQNKFPNCTILTIAHRIQSIIDSDRVLVMDGGRIIEFDTPYNLLQKSDGVFNDMVKAIGATESEKLFRIAANKHNPHDKK